MADVVFPDLGCVVSLPTSAQFRALSETSSRHEEFEVSRLEGAEVCFDGSVLLSDGIRLHAVEVTPTLLPYEPSEREERILRHVISLTKSAYCYRNFREDLPEHLQDQIPDLWVLDYSRVRMIEAPLLKVIRGYIEDNDPRAKGVQSENCRRSCKVRCPCPETPSTNRISARDRAWHNLNGIATIQLGSKLLILRDS